MKEGKSSHMQKVSDWIKHHELRLFDWINQKVRNHVLDYLFARITHLGGATFTISMSSIMIFISHGSLRVASIQSLIALIASHLPVAFLKKKYRRLRPYIVRPQTQLCIYPLKDHSFPSGHTTAIFAITVPFMMFAPLLTLLLAPLSLTVGYSRIYNGLHFPLDCVAGAFLGVLTSLSVVILWV